CISQNLPCSAAAMAASAAGIACSWNGSGLLRHTTRSLSPYLARMASMVGSTREQNGHWKSLHSIIVTSASGLPRVGAVEGAGTFQTVVSAGGGPGGGPCGLPAPGAETLPFLVSAS